MSRGCIFVISGITEMLKMEPSECFLRRESGNPSSQLWSMPKPHSRADGDLKQSPSVGAVCIKTFPEPIQQPQNYSKCSKVPLQPVVLWDGQVNVCNSL